MATDDSEEQQQADEQRPASSARQSRVKPVKPLPTDRVGFDKQLLILRGYAKASHAADGQAVSNPEVAEYAHLHMGSVSSCNPFLIDIGLLSREGLRNRPAPAVVEYDQAAEWNPDKAGTKLGPVIEQSWFGQVMLRRLALRPSMPKSAAIEVLAEEARAGKEYRLSLEMLLDYLRVGGVIAYDGTTVQRAVRTNDLAPGSDSAASAHPTPAVATSAQPPAPQPSSRNVERFSIPLPGKESVIIEMPKDMDADDWVMLGSMLAQYIRRWKKYGPPKELADATKPDDEF